MTSRDPVRVVHVDPQGFEDLSVERELFERAFDDVVFEGVDTGGDAIADDVGEADILLTHYATVTASALDATGCSVVTCYATGVDNVDVEAATERGVAVTNVPEYCDQEVGEHIVSLALALLRGLPQYDDRTAAGGWDWRSAAPVRTTTDLRFGFFAFGRKARAAAERAEAFGFDLLAHDPYLDDDAVSAANAEPVSFDDLVERSDVLSLNAPLTPETEGAIDETVFGRLPDDAVLVNTARGKLVDESALLDALERGTLHGAGLDVLAQEPPADDNPLLDRSDTIVTPHAAWFSGGAVERLRRRGTGIAIDAFEGESVDGVVNPDAFG
jgi:D-3-phosphoglycerate dehydrogenase